ncbi:leucine-rich repeat domain-containing protein [Bacillus sp. AFS041924]|uniref:leucine-rich repeat domain-containing protein n=1 Tax=Bacillus sp. AFS041924 TaxID=2033503 RepID=UPI000BFE826E|nr:leucine-rich repeat domain-containing protein [Bacillus sp. AFS041924]PGS52652.1 polysaccharide deacetylase [Bacillus sp. AFS041924]
MKKLNKETLRDIISMYYKRKFWRRLISDIKSHNTKSSKSQSKERNIPYVNKPGIAFSFDDSFRVNDWYEYGKDLFGYYDVKVTFNINAFHHYEGQREHTQEEIDQIIEMQAMGHEIAHHGFRHKNAANYVDENGLCTWIDEEIKTLFNWVENQTHSETKEKLKKPVTFAFPFSSYTEQIVSEITPKYFKCVRGELNSTNLVEFNHTGFVPSICIDQVKLDDVNSIKKILKIAKDTGKNVLFMCHSILPNDVDWNDFGWGKESEESGKWRISTDTIKSIIDEAKKLDLAFYTTAEIGGVATFIDKNMEKAIREKMPNPFEQWISISKLSEMTELDLSGKNISNLDGIQYFMNLEKLNLSHNHITDFRLLDKLPKLKKLDVTNNPINEEQYYSKNIAKW